jgi:hypothetical protein
VWSWQHTNNNCASGVSYGQGLVGKVVGQSAANMSDTFFGQNYGIFSEYLSYTLPKKLKNGKPWELFVGINGTTSFLGNEGVIINVGHGAQHRNASHKSTSANLKQLIQLHRQK